MTGGQFLFIFTSDTLTSPHHDQHWDVFLIHFQPNTFLSPNPNPPFPPSISPWWHQACFYFLPDILSWVSVKTSSQLHKVLIFLTLAHILALAAITLTLSRFGISVREWSDQTTENHKSGHQSRHPWPHALHGRHAECCWYCITNSSFTTELLSLGLIFLISSSGFDVAGECPIDRAVS